MELWSEEFVSEITFLKYCSFDSCGAVINPKLGQKGSKLVFHAPMVIRRYKSIVKRNLRWSVHFWNHYLKIFKFWLPMVTSKRSKLVFRTPVLLETWKSKVKGTLRWIIHLWNCSLKILKFWITMWCHQPKIGLKKGPSLYLMYYWWWKDENKK